MTATQPNEATTPTLAPTPATFADDPYRGPYPTGLGKLTTCPLHAWAAPSLSLIDGAAPVCWETGHVWDEGEALRVAR